MTDAALATDATQGTSSQAGAAAPTATPAPDASAAPDGQPGQDGTQTPEAKPDKPERTFTKDELDRIVDRARRKESRRAETLAYERARREIAEQKLAELTGTARQGGDSSGRAPGERPRQEDFKDYDAYIEAVADWKVEQRIKAQADQAGKRSDAEREAEYAARVQKQMAAGRTQYDDFDEVIGAPGVTFTDLMVDALLAVEGGHDVAYNLAMKPEETQRIASLPKAQQVLAIHEYAASLKKPPAPTTAPEPIKPGKAEGVAVKTLETTANNYAEWLKVRNRQLGRG